MVWFKLVSYLTSFPLSGYSMSAKGMLMFCEFGTQGTPKGRVHSAGWEPGPRCFCQSAAIAFSQIVWTMPQNYSRRDQQGVGDTAQGKWSVQNL